MKYRQRGYKEDEREEERREQAQQDRPPRRDPDLPGGRLADPQQVLRHMRCHRCGGGLPLEWDARGHALPVPRDASCGNCSAAVHACRNCIHFDPDAHLECRRPVKVRYRKDAANDCELFEPKVVAELTRDASRGRGVAPSLGNTAPKVATTDARKAFEKLFSK